MAGMAEWHALKNNFKEHQITTYCTRIITRWILKNNFKEHQITTAGTYSSSRPN